MKYLLLLFFGLAFIFTENNFFAEIPGGDDLNLKTKERINKWLKRSEIDPIGGNEAMVINLWATWCAPCIQEVPHLNGFVEAYKDKPVRFLAFSEEAPSVWKKFQKNRPNFSFHFEQEFGNGNMVRYLKSLDRNHQGRAIPIHVLIAPDGTVIDVMTGASAANLVKIQTFLDEL